MKKIQQRKTKPIGVAGSWIGIILFAVLLIIFLIFDSKTLFGKAEDLGDMIEDKGQIEVDEYATVNALLCYGQYGETNYKWNGVIPAGKKKHYVVYAEDCGYVSVSAKSKKLKKKLEDLEKATEKYFLTGEVPEAVKFKGKTVNMMIDQTSAYKSTTSLITSAMYDSQSRVNLKELDTSKGRMSSWMTVVFIIFLEALFVLTLLKAIKRKKLEQANIGAISYTGAADQNVWGTTFDENQNNNNQNNNNFNQ